MEIIKKAIAKKREMWWVLYGAFCFWLPDVLIHAIARNNFDRLHVWLVTAACPLALVVGYFVIAHFSVQRISSMHSGLMILGMWCGGGIAIMLASSFAGAAFASAEAWRSSILISLATVIFPPFTAMLATYDGSLFALLIDTVLMVVEAATLSARMVQAKFIRAAG
jgi:hypothetical protein